MKIIDEIGKSSCSMEESINSDKHAVLTEPQASFVFVEKTDWRWFATNCSQTVYKSSINYTNIVFANEMLASVYAALVDYAFSLKLPSSIL